MARASLQIDFKAFDKLIAGLNDEGLKTQLRNVVGNDGITALVSQAIADNFRQEGPGWAPLKAQTIRASVAKKLRKTLSNMSDAQLLKHEAQSRTQGSDQNPNRQILRRTSLLYNTVTTAGYAGSSTNNQRAVSNAKRKKATNSSTVSGQNIRRVEGVNLIWGTNLIYAGVHNNGKPPIPQREFLVIRESWQKRLYEYAFNEMTRIINAFFEVNK